MNPYILELQETDPAQAFASICDQAYSLFLDSADRNHPAGRYSFILCRPIETIEAKNGKVTVTNRDQKLSFTADPFKVLQERLDIWRDNTKTFENLPPFQGGAAGFFGYDLGRNLETLPETAKDNPAMPDMAVGIYDQVLAFDHAQQRSWIITHANDEFEARIKQRGLLELIEGSQLPAENAPVDMKWEPNFEAFEYIEQVRKVIDYIKAGDIFQANLSQRFNAELPKGFDTYAHYLQLREINPAPFAAFMNCGNIKISSASPERFLTVNDGNVETRPIKGTRPRGSDPVQDKVYRAELQNDAKERAENTMIVDLLRNDLSKACTADSVEVQSLCRLETFASVHHLVSTIKGKLRNGLNALDLLRACFPGGSITGAPKIRAMEIIEELEPTRRGPYCGSMGYIGFDGTMDTNILIRTLVFEGNKVSFQTGGGITADSDPDAEYQETFDKADAIFRSFEGDSYEIEADYLEALEA